MHTALAQGMEHRTEDSDSFSRLLSHVAKHMLVLQGEGPAQPTCLGMPPPPLHKAICCPPPNAQCGGLLRHDCGLSSPHLVKDATSQCSSDQCGRVQTGGMSGDPDHLFPGHPVPVHVTKIVVLMSQDPVHS